MSAEDAPREAISDVSYGQGMDQATAQDEASFRESLDALVASYEGIIHEKVISNAMLWHANRVNVKKVKIAA